MDIENKRKVLKKVFKERQREKKERQIINKRTKKLDIMLKHKIRKQYCL